MPFSRLLDRRRFGWLLTRPIAHRGLHDGNRRVPENSLKAFARAAARRLPFELDVHLSADGEAIVFHDATLQRMTGVTGRLADVSLADLKRLRLTGGDQAIPALSEVLAQTRGRVGILIELKTEAARDTRLEARVRDLLRGYRGPVAVQSFNPATIAWFAAHARRWPRGQLSYTYRDAKLDLKTRRRLADMSAIKRNRADFIGYHVKALPQPALARWRRLGVAALAWTIRTRAERERAQGLVDNMIFEGFTP